MTRIWWDFLPVTRSLLYMTQTFILILFLLTVCSSEVCKKVNSCQCQYRDGSVINLKSLGSHGKARWQNQVSNDSYLYFYNPCYEFKLPENAAIAVSECTSGVAACQVCTNLSCYYSIGTQQSADFVWDEEKKLLNLRYSSASQVRHTNVALICDPRPDANDTLTVTGEVSTGVYEMVLRSRCACPDLCGPHRGLSGGSVLIILFSVFVILYLFFGIVFNKLTRGAQGWELIPNYEFWQDFPLLVRDGCVYVASGCKADTTYERI